MIFTIKSLNISENKGEIKKPVESVILDFEGITTDAHRGKWHRQVSLLADEQVKEFAKIYKQDFKYGDFAENITTEGIDFRKTKVLDRLVNDNVEMMITQKGKKCHGGGCAVFEQVGHCVMPKEGIFAKVIKAGKLNVGDALEYRPKVFNVAVITLSDRASRGEYKDLSGPVIGEMCTEFFTSIDRLSEINYHIIPDSAAELAALINKLKFTNDFIITTGGTGISERDITIETVKPMITKELPGIGEMVRVKYGQVNPNALLSRSIAGTIGKTFIFCLPGSPKAVKEYMTEIFTILDHAIYMVYGFDNH